MKQLTTKPTKKQYRDQFDKERFCKNYISNNQTLMDKLEAYELNSLRNNNVNFNNYFVKHIAVN